MNKDLKIRVKKNFKWKISKGREDIFLEPFPLYWYIDENEDECELIDNNPFGFNVLI